MTTKRYQHPARTRLSLGHVPVLVKAPVVVTCSCAVIMGQYNALTGPSISPRYTGTTDSRVAIRRHALK
ncbi:hypothetical protein DM02DRAFT_419473 [Periconia macrospinosa]|uniref:Uncharacterized protein n=1 Tax=Periconia macrospinosa TaxID=97972 RepID=A0A2V1DNJ3_9PLEO|nr:hypothetical protein DM02DRAFT_419473 [Periconia macrospinosa]